MWCVLEYPHTRFARVGGGRAYYLFCSSKWSFDHRPRIRIETEQVRGVRLMSYMVVVVTRLSGGWGSRTRALVAGVSTIDHESLSRQGTGGDKKGGGRGVVFKLPQMRAVMAGYSNVGCFESHPTDHPRSAGRL